MVLSFFTTTFIIKIIHVHIEIEQIETITEQGVVDKYLKHIGFYVY